MDRSLQILDEDTFLRMFVFFVLRKFGEFVPKVFIKFIQKGKQMFMRYYPKQLKSGRKIISTPKDKGKRHYWSIDKGDYGFFQSEDKKDCASHRRNNNNDHFTIVQDRNTSNITSMIQKSKQIQNTFREKVNSVNPQYDGYQHLGENNRNIENQYIRSIKTPSRIGKIRKTPAKNLNAFKDEEQIYLPKLSNKYQQQNNQVQYSEPKRYINLKQVSYQTKPVKQSHRRHKTQGIYQPYDYFDNMPKWEDQRFRSYRSHLKHSPTFTSSIENPLPVPYMRFPSRYRTYEYKIAQS